MNMNTTTIVITGASQGLGKAAARHFSQCGANVILVARTQSALQQVQQEIADLTGHAPLIISGDITSESDVDQMAAAINAHGQQVDVLVNNAGIGVFQESEHMSNQEMRRHFEVNVFGAYYCTKALLPLIKQSQSGYILNIGSIFSRIALKENSVYAATKFALAGFTEGLRRELKPYGIGVGLILLGPMRTAFQSNRDVGVLAVPNWFTRDPRQIAEVLERMILRKKRTVIFPIWMLLALKTRYLFG